MATQKKQKKFMEKTEVVRAGMFGGQLIKLEHTAFGWEYLGYDTDVEYSVTDEGKIKKHHFKRMVFKRDQPYAHNLLFKLTELLARIISFIRRLLMSLMFFAVIGAILALTMLETPSIAGIICGVYAGAIGATILFAILGKLWRAVFKIDEKHREELIANGYDAD